MNKIYVIGVDFGSDSARAVLVDAKTGEICRETAALYPRWKEGLFCNASQSQYRQHPLDYLEVLEETVRGAAEGIKKNEIKSIAIDTTGSTPCPVNREGVPLALLEEFCNNPNAMFWLWKDHTSIEEARQLTEYLENSPSGDYTIYQGSYSAEWYWAKALHGIRVDKGIKEQGYAWTELCDWLAGNLAGRLRPEEIIRCSCGAGHKAYWDVRFGGLPPLSCFEALDRDLGAIAKRYHTIPQPAGRKIGTLTREWSDRLGLDMSTVVGTGSFDAHAGAVGAGIRPYRMVKVAGTSTVDLFVAETEAVSGIHMKDCCNQALDSILPGMVGIEAGQAAFGDIFSWLKRILLWPARQIGLEDRLVNDMDDRLLTLLEEQAKNRKSPLDIISVDWFNGRRYPDINECVRGGIAGLSLGTDCVDLYRSLVYSAVFGSRRILDSFKHAGLRPQEVVVVGGIAKKSPYIMQQMADCLEMPVKTVDSTQVCALGAAIYASVAAGIHPNIAAAQEAMSPVFDTNYLPEEETFKENRRLYKNYIDLGGRIEQWTLKMN